MKHNVVSFQREIVEQILISELCFEVCESIPGFPGLGNHFLPYFYNLNFQKGLDSLHSLLLSNDSNELSLKNYINLYNGEKDIDIFKKNANKISNDFKKIASFPLRNKIGSHIDGDFTHIDFTTGYLMPGILNDLIIITRRLKVLYFNFTEYALNDNSYNNLRNQIYELLNKFTIQECKNLRK